MKKKIKKKRNPNDTTFRNINALKKRMSHHENVEITLVEWVTDLDDRVEKLEALHSFELPVPKRKSKKLKK